MSRALCIIILAAAVTVDASRDESDKVGELVHVSVKPTNFQLLKPTESANELDLDEKVNAQPEGQAMTLGQAAGLLAKEEVAGISKGLSKLQGNSSALRKAVDEFSASEGLTDAAQKAEAMQKAKHGLQLLVQESKRVKELADDLDQNVQGKYEDLLQNEIDKEGAATNKRAEAKEASVANEQAAPEDAELPAGTSTEAWDNLSGQFHEGAWDALNRHFHEVASKKEALVRFFDGLKQLQQARDRLRDKKAQAVKEALTAGLSEKEVEQEMASALQDAHTTSFLEEVDSGNPEEIKERLAQQQSTLNSISQFQVSIIERAAHEIIGGLDELDKWRHSGDKSPEAMKKFGQVQAKIAENMKFMEEHRATKQMNIEQVGKLKSVYDDVAARMAQFTGKHRRQS